MTFIDKQHICRDFVRSEVKANITDFAEYLFGDECSEHPHYADYEEFSNCVYRMCPHCGCIVESEDDFNNWAYDEDGNELDNYVCPDCGEEYESLYDLEIGYNEPCEYYLVSEYLGRKLKNHGEVVLERPYGNWIWGRCGSGQAIYIDGVIEKICEEAGLFKDKEEK